jgi:hypothetical protein
LRDWQKEGVWELLHFALLDWLAREGDIDWSRAIVDSCSVRAVRDGTQTGPNPTDRGKRGSKRHLICDGHGIPLAVRLTGANLGRWRWVVERTFAWLNQFRRLRVRYDKRADLKRASRPRVRDQLANLGD